MQLQAIYTKSSSGIPQGSLVMMTFLENGTRGAVQLLELVQRYMFMADDITTIRLQQVASRMVWEDPIRTFCVRTQWNFDLSRFCDLVGPYLEDVEFLRNK